MSDSNDMKIWLAGRAAPFLSVRRFSIREDISALWSAQIDVTCEDGSFAIDDYIDRGAAFSLERHGRPTTPVRLWTGVCSTITHVASERLSTYRVTIVPELWRLSLGRSSRVFQHASVPEIVLAVLAEWEMSPPTNVSLRNIDLGDRDRFPKFEARVQFEESDFTFIARMLEEAGITFYFEYANVSDGKARNLTKLVLDGEPQSAASGERAAPGTKTLRRLSYEGTQGAARFGSADDLVVNAQIERVLVSSATTLVDHDFRLPTDARPLEKKSSSDGVSISETKYETFAYVPGLLQREVEPASGDQYVSTKHASHAHDQLLSQRVFARRTTFATNALEVCPGSVVAFDGDGLRSDLAGAPFLVTETEISGDTMGGWHVRCAAAPAEVAFRPPRITPKPRIWGMQSAIVVGPKAETKEQIHCDEHARVRVQFHWDRFHEFGHDVKTDDGDVRGSCWVRVGMPWAGAGYGFVAIPRVGHEVLVAFLDGDPDLPVIVRSLHNDDHPPPFSPEHQPMVSGLRSNSTPGGVGYNELSFDDTAGAERINVQAQRNLSTLVKAAESHSVGAARRTSVGDSDTLHVKNEWKLVAGNKETGVWVNQNKLILAQVNGASGAQVLLSGTGIFVNAKADIHLHAGKDIHFSAVGKVDMDASKVNINEPGRSPEAVELPDYAPANAPQPGRNIGFGAKPVPRAEQREKDRSPPRPLLADVDFEEPPPPPRPPPTQRGGNDATGDDPEFDEDGSSPMSAPPRRGLGQRMAEAVTIGPGKRALAAVEALRSDDPMMQIQALRVLATVQAVTGTMHQVQNLKNIAKAAKGGKRAIRELAALGAVSAVGHYLHEASQGAVGDPLAPTPGAPPRGPDGTRG